MIYRYDIHQFRTASLGESAYDVTALFVLVVPGAVYAHRARRACDLAPPPLPTLPPDVTPRATRPQPRRYASANTGTRYDKVQKSHWYCGSRG